jgi:hypothetical protein
MAKFLYKIFIFLLILKICDFLLSSFFFWYLQSKTSLTQDIGSLNRMYHGGINTNIVFFGSSRTSLHINPEVVEHITGQTAWNLGMDGSNFDQQEFTLEDFLLHNKMPKIVVFEADLVSLDPSLLRFKTELFLPYRNDSSHSFNLFNPSWDESLYYSLFSSTIYKPQMPAALADYKDIINRFKNGDYGYISQANSKIVIVNRPDYLLVNGAQLKKGQVPGQLPQVLPYPTPVRNFDLSEISLRENKFEELMKFANNMGFTLVLMFPPYMKGQIYEDQRRIAVDFYTKLSEKYKNIYFLDYSQDPTLDNNLNYWWDGNHLNIKGANLFSKEIGEELDRILKNKK